MPHEIRQPPPLSQSAIEVITDSNGTEPKHDPAVAFSAVDNAIKAVVAIGDLSEAHPGKCGGKLLLKGTRFSIGQLIAELADDGASVRTVCENYDLDCEQVVDVLHALATGLSSPVA